MPTVILNLCYPHVGTNVNYARDLVVYVYKHWENGFIAK